MLGVTLLLALPNTASAQDDLAEIQYRAETAEPKESRPWLGLGIDVGVPDGANIAAIWRPYHWLRFHAGGSHNLVGFGLRGGLSLIPFDEWISPSLVLEGGRFFDGDLQGFMEGVLGVDSDAVPERVSYNYANLHLGLELGSPDFTFYLRGGYSLVDAQLTPAEGSGGDDIRFEGDATVTVLAPSAKLGFILYIL